MEKQNSNEKNKTFNNKPLPEDVLNPEQDPASVPDPLKEQLERAERIEESHIKPGNLNNTDLKD